MCVCVCVSTHHVWEILDYITLYYYTFVKDYIALYITLPLKHHCSTRKIVETKSVLILVVLISGGAITYKVLLLETELRAISSSSTVSWSSLPTYDFLSVFTAMEARKHFPL